MDGVALQGDLADPVMPLWTWTTHCSIVSGRWTNLAHLIRFLALLGLTIAPCSYDTMRHLPRLLANKYIFLGKQVRSGHIPIDLFLASRQGGPV